MHSQELESNPQKPVFGLKYNSALNSLKFIPVCRNFSLDIVHDVLEGVAWCKSSIEYLSESFIYKSDFLASQYILLIMGAKRIKSSNLDKFEK